MTERMITHKIAIVGGGPKGLYGFERLVAWFTVCPPDEKVEIHIFNKTDSFGSGANYRPQQQSFLLMNNPVGQIKMWGDEFPPPVVDQALSFTEWFSSTEGRIISDHDYTSRAMAGRYLSQGFESIASNLPDNVGLRQVIGDVVDIAADSGKYVFSLRQDGRYTGHRLANRYDHVLLATGHPTHRQTQQTSILRSFADEHDGTAFVPFVYPAETAFSKLSPSCSVGVKGLGLTFVDAVLALTEGKGGRFERDESTDKLRYLPSGEEPKVIYPFSRSGLPMIPRRSVPNKDGRLRFFTGAALQTFEAGKELDFNRQIWPLLKQDMIAAHYDVAMTNAGFSSGLPGEDFAEMESSIARFHDEHPCELPFDIESFLEPAPKPGSHDQFIKSLYDDYVREARKGERDSPLAAVTAVWRMATSLFCEVYSFGGITPQSQQHFDHCVRGKLNRVTFGPPVENAEKLLALMDAGILNFDAAKGPELILDAENGRFVLESKPDGVRYPVHCLVDARIPKVSLADDPGTLFGNLLDRGLISLYENSSGDELYRPGAVNISRRGFVIDENGAVSKTLAVTGTPTEGVTFDNDTLCRERNNVVDGWAESISTGYANLASKQYAN